MKNTFLAILAAMTVAGCAGPMEQQRRGERDRLKREILDELRAELGVAPRGKASPLAETSPQPTAMKSPSFESPQTTPAALAAAIASEPASAEPAAPALPAVLASRVEGRLLWGGSGLASVRVRIVHMEAFRAKRAADYRANDYYDDRTDAEGRYRFTAVDPGQYKLLWVPSAADYWVRRIADRPDVTIEPGRTGVVGEIETKRKVLGD